MAEDLLQETLLTIHARIETFNPDYEFMPWAYTIARNKFFEFKRNQKKVVRILPAEFAESVPASHRLFSETSDLSHDLADVLAELSEPVKEAFVLKHFQGLKFNEVADLQQVPVPTAKSRVLFALHLLPHFVVDSNIRFRQSAVSGYIKQNEAGADKSVPVRLLHNLNQGRSAA